MSRDETTQAFLQEILLQISPDLQTDVLRLQDMWEQKLWHELTETLITIFNHPESASFRLPVYNNFILQFADKINQLKLVDLALKAAQQCSGQYLEEYAHVFDYAPVAGRLTSG